MTTIIGNNPTVSTNGSVSSTSSVFAMPMVVPAGQTQQVTAVELYMDFAGGAAGGTTGNLKVVLYDSTFAVAGTTRALAMIVAASGQAKVDWIRLSFASLLALPAGVYYAVPMVDVGAIARYRYANGASGNSLLSTNGNYASPPNPLGATTAQTFNFSMRAFLENWPVAPSYYIGNTLPAPVGSQTLLAAATVATSPVTPSEPGVIDRIDIDLSGAGGTAGQTQVSRAAVYADAGASTPAGVALGTSSTENAVTNGEATAWRSYLFTSAVALAALTPYHLGIESGTTTNIAAIQFRTGVTGDGRTATIVYGNPSPTYPGTSTATTRQNAIRANFTPDLAPQKLIDPSVAPLSAGAGVTLTATPGVYVGSPVPAVTGKWQRDGVDIVGATNSTYATASADLGHTVTYVEVATSTGGSAAGTSNGVPVAADVAAGTPHGYPMAGGALLMTSATGTATGNGFLTNASGSLATTTSLSGATWQSGFLRGPAPPGQGVGPLVIVVGGSGTWQTGFLRGASGALVVTLSTSGIAPMTGPPRDATGRLAVVINAA